MKSPHLIVLGVLLFCSLSLGEVGAQTYIPIDTSGNLYCADFPNTDAQIVRYDTNAGEIFFLNPEAVTAEYQATLDALKKRKKALQKLQKREKDKNFVKKFKKNYKLAFGKKFKGGEFKAENALGKTIRRVAQEMRRIQSILDDIRRCEDNEIDSLPFTGSLQFIEFPFTHPDFGSTYYMFGVGVLFNVKPGKKLGSQCLSFTESGGYSGAAVYPDRSQVFASSNPCAIFYPTTFRNFPNCGGALVNGSNNTRVHWIKVEFSTRPRSDRDKELIRDRVADMGPAIFSSFQKKRGCNY